VRERARPPEITRDRSRSLEGSARESALEIAITHEGCAREHITSPSRRSNVPSGCMVRGRVWHEEAVTRCQVLAAGRWDGVGGAMPMPKGAMGGMPCMQRTPAMPGMPCVPVAIRMEGWQVRLQAASVRSCGRQRGRVISYVKGGQSGQVSFGLRGCRLCVSIGCLLLSV